MLFARLKTEVKLDVVKSLPTTTLNRLTFDVDNTPVVLELPESEKSDNTFICPTPVGSGNNGKPPTSRYSFPPRTHS